MMVSTSGSAHQTLARAPATTKAQPVSTWNRVLDAAEIRSPHLRSDFTRQHKLVRRYKPQHYVATRLLLPSALVPHVVVATAFMHHTDNLLDSGPRRGRAGAFARWNEEVREALGMGHSTHPLIRPLLHAVATHPCLASHVEEFLDGARTDLNFTGFATEADYQRYIDQYSLPAFMVIANLLTPTADSADYRSACRRYIDGSQRLDFVNDLSEDLRDGRLAIPLETLDRHGVTRTDLEHVRDTAQVRALLQDLLGQALRTLASSREITQFVPPAHRPLVRTLIAVEERSAEAAMGKGAALLAKPARPPLPTMVALLLREYRHAWGFRRAAVRPI
ncbi:phytoene/squalene synthase family protein [Streptomyces sp. NPDC017993]|uniref:phytoene/squalene synthase family protein n=1 Tax=Streptomyces sp. NPDC017993 TaxID=3365027 RepID=UPI0037A3AD20